MSDAALAQLARRAGIAVHWQDHRGEPRTVSPDSQRALLSALGYPADSAAAVRAADAALQARQAAPAPLLTAEPGARVACPGLRGGEALQLNGNGVAIDVVTGEDGDAFLIAPATPGCYQLEGGGHAFRLAVAPPRCTSIADRCGAGARPFGVAAQIYGLAEPGDMGLASYTSLARLAGAAASQGADALACSPVHALFAADPARCSPYSPSNRLLLNVLHVDPDAAAGADAVAAAEAALGTQAVARELESAALVDWNRAGRLRLALLRALAPGLLQDTRLLRAFERFRRRHGATLESHARFEMLHARLGGARWQDWPARFQDPHGQAVARMAEEHADEVRFHALLQFLAHGQRAQAQRSARAAGMRIGLVADLAIGADPGGSQAWADQDTMLAGLTIGAPPDLLAPRGQDWGLAVFSPTALAASGFHAWRALLDACMSHSGGLRLDHVMGLQRLWLVPAGADSADGAYLAYPQQDLLRLLRLASWQRRCVVLGEDLGTVDPALQTALAEAGALGLSVLPFEHDGAGYLPPVRWRRRSVAMSSTHDLPTLAGWWSSHDLAVRAALGPPHGPADDSARQLALRQRDAEREALWQAMRDSGAAQGPAPASDSADGRTAFVDAALAHTASAASEMALLPLEDLLGQVEAPNLPGTVDEHPNWRRRLPSPASATLARPAVSARLARVRAARERGTRG